MNSRNVKNDKIVDSVTRHPNNPKTLISAELANYGER